MKLAVIEPLGVTEEQLSSLAAAHIPGIKGLSFAACRARSEEELIRLGADADIIITANQPLPASVLKCWPRLRMISVAFTGVDHVDLAFCRSRGIAVCNCAGYSTAAVSDLVFAMVLSLYRRLSACDSAVRSGKSREGLVGLELEGKTFGIIGTGAIGTRTAAIARAFGCRVLAYSRTDRKLPGVTSVSLDELLRTSDIVSLHVPLTDETRGLIGADEIRQMKPGAILINTARGPVVDSNALAEALMAHRIAGAGIDVFETEPPLSPEHPLLQAPGVIAAPHIGFATKEALEKRAVIAFENVSAWLAGHPQNLV